MKRDHLAKHSYPNWHEIKDLVSIYRESEWDDAEVTVWDINEKRYKKLIFVGSSRPNEEKDTIGKIHFIIEDYDRTGHDEDE